jgi:hypothetical protein
MCDILMECRSFAKTGSGQLKGKPTKLFVVCVVGRSGRITSDSAEAPAAAAAATPHHHLGLALRARTG